MTMNGHPLSKPYVHAAVRLENEIVERMDGQVIQPMTRSEFTDQHARDVSALPAAPLVEVYPDKETGTVTLIMDERTAAAAIYAVRLLATEREAHAREVRTIADRFPEGSYGAANRSEIADRQERVAKRLRAVEWAYGRVVDTYWHGI